MDMPIPDWLTAELLASHPGIEVKWMPWGERKVFVLPMFGDAFYRMPSKKLNVVLYRRYITPDSPMRWKLHDLTYIPSEEFVTSGRFVVYQHNYKTGETVKLFDVINDDGSFLALDMRIITAIQHRDRKFGAHEKAIEDVDSSKQRALAEEHAKFDEIAIPAFEEMFFDISRKASDHACVTPDPTEDFVSIQNLREGDTFEPVHNMDMSED